MTRDEHIKFIIDKLDKASTLRDDADEDLIMELLTDFYKDAYSKGKVAGYNDGWEDGWVGKIFNSEYK